MYKLPLVNEEGLLEFDSRAPIPMELPLFEKVEDQPNCFRPKFCECKFRTLATRPLTMHPTCLRRRQVWFCLHFKEEVFPLQCSQCPLTEEAKLK